MNEFIFETLVSLVKVLIGVLGITALIGGLIFVPFIVYFGFFKLIGMVTGTTIGVWASAGMTVFTLFLIACIK